MANAEPRERVGDGVRDRGRRRDRTALADPLRAEWVVRRRRLDEGGAERRDLVGRQQRVVRERRGPQLAVLIVDGLLDEALAETLRDRPEHLTLGEQRVDDLPRVVDA